MGTGDMNFQDIDLLAASTTEHPVDGCGCGCSNEPAEHGYTPEKKRYLARLKRIEGQVRGVHRMVD